MTDFQLTAEPRLEQGKGASRRLRRAGWVPAIMYGAGLEAEAIALDKNELGMALLDRSFYTSIVKVNYKGQIDQVILRDLQRHPAKPTVVIHLDFMRVEAERKLRVRVPFTFLNEETAVGVKTEGGQISHQLVDAEVECLPRYIPDTIEVDVQDLHVNQNLHLSEIPLPEDVRFVDLEVGSDYDYVVVSMHGKATAADEDEDDEGGEQGSPE